MKFSCIQFLLLCSGASAFQVSSPTQTSSALKAWNGGPPGSNQNYGSSMSTQSEIKPSTSSSSFYTPTFPNGNAGTVQSDRVRSRVEPNISRDGKMMDGKSQMKAMWDTLTPTLVQGGSLRTWAFTTHEIERVNVMLRTDGRPLHAMLELWQGPDNTPVKMNVYNEDGNMRQFAAVIETPQGQNSIAIRNTGQMEFPLSAALAVDVGGSVGNGKADLGSLVRRLESSNRPRVVQGGAVQTFPFDASVSSVQVMITTDGRPLNTRIELLQGPNNIKQVIDLYCEDGKYRPFYAVFDTPGTGNVLRVVNTATMEFPLNIRIEAFEKNRAFMAQNSEDYFNVM